MVETREKQLHLKYSDLHYSLLLIQVYIQILYNKLVLSEKNRNRTGRKMEMAWNRNILNNWIGLNLTELSLDLIELT